MSNNFKLVSSIAVVLLLVVLFFGSRDSNPVKLGSVQDGHAYTSTTTYNFRGAPTFQAVQVLKLGQGVLGSVVITGAVAGAMTFYDATSTTDTGSTTITVFPASAGANTYTFDVAFTRGLIVGTSAGLAPTTTITLR